jgi:hypothetical protein
MSVKDGRGNTGKFYIYYYAKLRWDIVGITCMLSTDKWEAWVA